MDTISERVKQTVHDSPHTPAELAKRSGMAYTTLMDVIHGRTQRPKRLPELAEALGVRYQWLVSGRGPRLNDPQTVTQAIGRVIRIPHLDVTGSMGDGATASEDYRIIDTVEADAANLRRTLTFTAPDNLRLITGLGESMMPTFTDGDLLIVDVGVTDVKADAIYVLSRGDELFIKRLQRRPDGGFTMKSDNRLYDDFVISRDDLHSFNVLARVLGAWKLMRF